MRSKTAKIDTDVEIEAKRIQRGQLVLLTGTSAGFSIGGVLIKY